MPNEGRKMHSGNDAEPVHNGSELPRMTDTPLPPTPVGGKIMTMADEPKADTGKRNRMVPFEKSRAERARRDHPDQEAPRHERRGSDVDEGGYVRLRLRVTDGDISVIGAKAVEGPLVEGNLQGALAYEVVLGDTRIAAGSIPDVGERRSFPDPQGMGEMRGHHITEMRSYDISVRVPKSRISRSAMSRLEIALYRIKEELPEPRIDRLPERSIGEQFGRQLREVGRMKGLRPDRLNEAAAEQVRRAFDLD